MCVYVVDLSAYVCYESNCILLWAVAVCVCVCVLVEVPASCQSMFQLYVRVYVFAFVYACVRHYFRDNETEVLKKSANPRVIR